MRLVLISILIVSIWAKDCTAAPSLLGMCHKDWDCNATIKLYDGFDAVILSWLENTFGRDCKCADRLLNDARPKIIRAHLINSPCMRNKRCGRYEALWGYTAASGSRAALQPRSRLRRRFGRILETFRQRIEGKDITCYVSPCLECDLYAQARRTLADLVSVAVPSCIVVDSPYRQRCLRGTICEKHGENPGVASPCIVDMDGTDGATIDVKKWLERYSYCDLRYYWEPWMNCIRGEFIDPRERNCSYDASIFEATKEILCQYFYPLSDICSL